MCTELGKLLGHAAGSDIVGKTIRQAAFSSRFHAAIVSVKRDNVALSFDDRKIGDEVLQASPCQGHLVS